ncbi:MAG: DUF5615 family PIN-like protein [Bacteroidia bacterium]
MIVADEGLNANFIWELRDSGYEIEWIGEIGKGMDDYSVIEYVQEKSGVLITEDKDFGEWVFSHHISGLTIIFLRYEKADFPVILNFLKVALKEIENAHENEFITINRNKIRKRKI